MMCLGLLRGGNLAARRASIDLLADDLDMGVLNVGSFDEDKADGVRAGGHVFMCASCMCDSGVCASN